MQINSIVQAALALQSTNTITDSSVAAAQKALSVQKQQGEMAVELIQSAVMALSNTIGTKINTVV